MVDISAITNTNFVRRLQAQSAIPISQPGQTLRAYVNPKGAENLSKEQRQLLIPLSSVWGEIATEFLDRWSPGEVSFLEVQIGKPTDKQAQSLEFRTGGLWLIVEGLSPSDLRSSMIDLPKCVSQEPARSLSHAFTILSEVFEPWANLAYRERL